MKFRDITKILFLDIDGVLNNTTDMYSGNWKSTLDYKNWNEKNLANLDRICKETECAVVISSTWRKHESRLPWWREQFNLADCPHVEVIDIPPSSRNGFRGREVQDWMDFYEPTRYVIFDDDSDFYPEQNFIHIDSLYGLTYKDAELAIDFLNEKIDELPEVKRRVEVNPPALNN